MNLTCPTCGASYDPAATAVHICWSPVIPVHPPTDKAFGGILDDAISAQRQSDADRGSKHVCRPDPPSLDTGPALSVELDGAQQKLKLLAAEVRLHESRAKAKADRALRDKLAMELFRDRRNSCLSQRHIFDPEACARTALEHADIFMAERAKRDVK